MSGRFDVTLVTYEGAPEGTPDDRILAGAITGLGGRARFAIWDDRDVDWSASATTIIRSTWDYFRKVREWRDWLQSSESVTRLVNPAELVRWNMDKSYLLDLAGAGIAIVPTIIVKAATPFELAGLCEAKGWNDIVVKPAIAASSHGAKRFLEAEITTAGDAHLRSLSVTGDVLVQPYQSAVEHERERSLVFAGGKYLHAFSRHAFDPNAAIGDANPSDHHSTDAEIQFANEVVKAVGSAVTFARVDIVPTPEGLRLMELELIEPYLGLRRNPGSALALGKLLLETEGQGLLQPA